MNLRISILVAIVMSKLCAEASIPHEVNISINPLTGAIDQLVIEGDSTQMNWLLSTDGSQYPWVTDEYGWGLGYFTECRNHTATPRKWKSPVSQTQDGGFVVYQEGDIQIEVTRRRDDNSGDLVETYAFTNKGHEVAALQDVSIFVPFNDNYPDSKTCITSRANTHIWDGENGAWINALRMGGKAPHLGLVLTQGSIIGYEVHQRGIDKGNSQYRGIFSVNIPDFWLKPGESYALQWRIFPHEGSIDFNTKIVEKGSVLISADKYVGEIGDTINVNVRFKESAMDLKATANRRPVKAIPHNGTFLIPVPIEELGDIKLEIEYNGKSTHASLLGISNKDNLINKRIDFIINHQQMQRPGDPRYGAYMIYDCEGDSIYLNDTPNCNPVDRDEGAERMGMGVLLAKKYRLTNDSVIGNSVKRYAKFVREGLQTPDYKVFSSVDQTNRNRGYNYMWVAELYFQLYLGTGEKQYAVDGYETLQSMFRQFGYNFYAIGIPVLTGLEALEKAGMKKERIQLLKDFERIGDAMIEIGLDYPPFEVNYEQSIVAPAIQFLSQMYIATSEKKYLYEVEHQLPVLEAFAGEQPSYHLNGIGIRHWDEYWFGKREMFGDTMPHYWSTITAAAFFYYYQITGNEQYLAEAEKIVDNNLCLFFEDGSASCAYLYPKKVNGIKGAFYDPYANDQDWALVYYLLVKDKI